MRSALILLGMAIAAPASAVTLNFDDLTGSTQIMTYGGFDFANFYALDTVGFPQSGYVNGVVSPTNVAYNADGHAASISAATPFSLTSGYVAAAWNDGLTVRLVGSLAGVTVFTQSFVVDTSHSVLETFDPALIDTVVFTTSGGTHHAGYNAGVGTQLSLDNLTINGSPPPAVPEPAMWALMVTGFGLVGGALRRPRRARAA
jgi:hypothetical protein